MIALSFNLPLHLLPFLKMTLNARKNIQYSVAINSKIPAHRMAPKNQSRMTKMIDKIIQAIIAIISSPAPPEGISPMGISGKLEIDFRFGAFAIFPKSSFNLKLLYSPQTMKEKNPIDSIVVDKMEFAKSER